MTGVARSHVPVPEAERVVSGPAGVGAGVRTRALTLTLTGRRYSANDRLHWRAERELKKEWRELGQVHARAASGPSPKPYGRQVRCTVTQVPGSRRKTDPGNVAPAAKAAIDGIVLAGLLADDDAAHLVGPDYRLAAEPVRQAPGMWTLRITITPLDPKWRPGVAM